LDGRLTAQELFRPAVIAAFPVHLGEQPTRFATVGAVGDCRFESGDKVLVGALATAPAQHAGVVCSL
jgi:hypothetical protein